MAIIEEIACPHCGHSRSVRLNEKHYICWYCRFRWRVSDGTPVSMTTYPFPFTHAEMTRLELYRAAIAAGCYTDDVHTDLTINLAEHGCLTEGLLGEISSRIPTSAAACASEPDMILGPWGLTFPYVPGSHR
jgi:hypothetical protein